MLMEPPINQLNSPLINLELYMALVHGPGPWPTRPNQELAPSNQSTLFKSSGHTYCQSASLVWQARYEDVCKHYISCKGNLGENVCMSLTLWQCWANCLQTLSISAGRRHLPPLMMISELLQTQTTEQAMADTVNYLTSPLDSHIPM